MLTSAVLLWAFITMSGLSDISHVIASLPDPIEISQAIQGDITIYNHCHMITRYRKTITWAALPNPSLSLASLALASCCIIKLLVLVHDIHRVQSLFN